MKCIRLKQRVQFFFAAIVVYWVQMYTFPQNLKKTIFNFSRMKNVNGLVYYIYILATCICTYTYIYIYTSLPLRLIFVSWKNCTYFLGICIYVQIYTCVGIYIIYIYMCVFIFHRFFERILAKKLIASHCI